jgi:hypothetical protein
MWNTRLQFNRDLGADLGFVMSMFANRRYMEDLQASEWRSDHDSLLFSPLILEQHLNNLGLDKALHAASTLGSAETKRITDLEKAVKKAGGSGGGAGAGEFAELNKQFKELANVVTQLSSGHKSLKEKVAKGKAAPAPAPLSAADQEKEKKRKHDYWAKKNPEEAAAAAKRKAEAAAADDN